MVADAAVGTMDWRAALEELRGAYADRTLAESSRVFASFVAWCQVGGHDALPVAPTTVAAYVGEMFGRLAASSLRQHLIVIRRVHEALDLDDPTRTRVVRLAYRRGARLHGTAVRQAAPLNATLRDRLLAQCGDGLLGRRDRAMISLGYDTLARRSELIAMQVEDLTPAKDGTASILVRRSKDDQQGLGRQAYMSARALAFVRAWQAAAGFSAGPILRPIQNGRAIPRQISGQTVTHRMRVLAAAAGVDPVQVAQLSAHSLRVGAAQDLASSGRTLLEVMRAGRWRDLQSVTDYTRGANVNVWAPGDGDTYPLQDSVLTRVRRGRWRDAR